MIMQPDEGPMACGEFGEGRLPDPEAILQEISKYFSHRRDKQRTASPENLSGKHILITAGPTHEPIDPVRYIRSEEHTSELQSLMSISYAVFCLKKKQKIIQKEKTPEHPQNNKTATRIQIKNTTQDTQVTKIYDSDNNIIR